MYRKQFYSMFEVVIQLGAILAVVILFWNQTLAIWKERIMKSRWQRTESEPL